jgi:hypothetical protein
MKTGTRSALDSSAGFGLTLLALLTGFAISTANAQLRLEIIPIESMTLSAQQILT